VHASVLRIPLINFSNYFAGSNHAINFKSHQNHHHFVDNAQARIHTRGRRTALRNLCWKSAKGQRAQREIRQRRDVVHDRHKSLLGPHTGGARQDEE
jgi:hypothetical protein